MSEPVPATGADCAELLAGLGGEAFGDLGCVRVSGITVDSRRTRPGDLFVGVPGVRTHGGLYAGEALRRGAAAVVVPVGMEVPDGCPGLRHPAPETLLGEIAARLYGRPGERLRIFGVTGTNGKTTTALLTAHLLAAGGSPVAYWTTTEVRAGDAPRRAIWTTPPAHRLQRFLRTAADHAIGDMVLEVSSHAVVQHRIAAVPFFAGIATNVSPDHLDFHGSFPAYVAAKRAFIAGLGERATAVLNAEDPIVRGFAAATTARCITVGFGDAHGVQAADVNESPHGVCFTVQVRDEGLLAEGAPPSFAARIRLMGRHNVLNTLCATAAALGAGIPAEAIARSLPAFLQPPRRLESREVGPFTVLNDVAMNEASYDTVCRTVASLGYPQVVMVHAIRGRRGPEINARIGRTLARWNEELRFAPLVVSLSRDRLGRYPVDYQVHQDELAAFEAAARAGGMATVVHRDLEPAIAEATERLQPGGILVLVGTFGMDDGPGLAVADLERRLGLPPSDRITYMEQRDPGN